MATDDMSVTALALEDAAFGEAPDHRFLWDREAVPLDRETFVRGLAMAVAGFAFNHAPDRVDEEAERIAKRIAAFIDKGRG